MNLCALLCKYFILLNYSVRFFYFWYSTFDLSVVDPDNDYIKCRMAEGSFECGGICNGLRNVILDGASISYQQYAISPPIRNPYGINVSL